MENYIDKQLMEIEKKYNVNILFAVEAGSRAWGIESPESDYDVRFVYIRKKDYYLRLETINDSILWKPDKNKNLDMTGWDIQKALRLLYQSNPSIIEWIHSPITYKSTLKFTGFRYLAEKYFSQSRCLSHYLNIAKLDIRNIHDVDVVKVRKYLYALRAVFNCIYIMKFNAPPVPIFSDLVDTTAPKEIIDVVNTLIEKKKSSDSSEIARIDKINEFLKSSVDECQKFLKTIEKNRTCTWDLLNDFFLELLSVEKNVHSIQKFR